MADDPTPAVDPTKTAPSIRKAAAQAPVSPDSRVLKPAAQLQQERLDRAAGPVRRAEHPMLRQGDSQRERHLNRIRAVRETLRSLVSTIDRDGAKARTLLHELETLGGGAAEARAENLDIAAANALFDKLDAAVTELFPKEEETSDS